MAQATIGASVATSTASFAPALTVIDGKITTTSNQVAEHFGKRHDAVLRAIRNLECSADFRLRNFVETVVSRENPSGGAAIESKAYRLTRDGFAFLAMGFTGKEAAQWKEAYINAFNKMEAELLAQSRAIPYTVQPGDKLNAKQQATLRELLETNAKRLPPEKQGPAIMRGWSKLKAHFKVGYRDIPAEQFTDAVSLLSRHVAELEVVEPVFPSINAAQLLLEGQSEHPLPNDVHTMIDRRAAEITVDAHMLIREHLQRRVSFRVNHYPDTSREQVADVLKEAELGNCLTHAYHSEVRRVLSMLGSAAQMAASSVQRLQAEMNALRPEPPTLMV